MRTTTQLVAALNSYTHLPTAPEVNLREHILVDMMGATNSALQEYEINKGFRLIDETLRYTAAAESLSFQMQTSPQSMAQMFQQHNLLNTGIEAKLIYPQGKRTKLSAAIEIITAVITLSCYIIAVALIVLVGKIFFFMTKHMKNTFAAVIKMGLKIKKKFQDPKMKQQYTTSKEMVTISDVEAWAYTSKVPKLLGGKKGVVKVKGGVLAKALLSEWILPSMKPYASLYINSPGDYDRLVKISINAADNLLKTVEWVDKVAQSLGDASRGRDGNTAQRVKMLEEIASRSTSIRQNIAVFNEMKNKHTTPKTPSNLDKISDAVSNYNYPPPSALLKVADIGESIEARIRSIEKNLKENKAEISKEDNEEITRGLAGVKKTLLDIHTQNANIDQIYSHCTAFFSEYLNYLNAMNSVDW